MQYGLLSKIYTRSKSDDYFFYCLQGGGGTYCEFKVKETDVDSSMYNIICAVSFINQYSIYHVLIHMHRSFNLTGVKNVPWSVFGCST